MKILIVVDILVDFCFSLFFQGSASSRAGATTVSPTFLLDSRYFGGINPVWEKLFTSVRIINHAVENQYYISCSRFKKRTN